ncbi:MAG: hypothetical protein ACREWI_05505 [Telluria sp.]
MSVLDPRLERAISLDEEGRYGEALALVQEVYAEIELEPAPDQRRYFMPLFQWKLLTEAYPPARTALVAARDEQAARLLAGALYTGSAPQDPDPREMFQRATRFSLIVDMNRTLKDPQATRALFLQLEADWQELPKHYAWLALPAIVEAGDFALADRYREDPLKQLAAVNCTAQRMPLFPPEGGAPRLAADLMVLAGDVRIGIAVLRGLGRADEAAALRAALLAGLEMEPLRALAERELDEPGIISREIAAHRMAYDDRMAAGQA